MNMSEPAQREASDHTAARSALRAAHRSGRLPHALMLTGEEGVGKAAFAEWLIQMRWCKGPDAPCRSCSSCRKVSTRNHPDLIHVCKNPSPEQDPDGWGSKHELTVDQVRRGVLPGLALRAVEGGGRAVILQDADDMNEEAQNALLKTLEEPPSGSLLVLVTGREEGLLETVRSRCQEIRLFEDADLSGQILGTGRDAERFQGLDVAGLVEAFDLLLQSQVLPTSFARTVQELTEGEDADEDLHRRLALRVMHQRLRDLAFLQGGGAPEGVRTTAVVDAAAFPATETLLAAEEAVLEATADFRRHVPAHVTWVALGHEIAHEGVGGPASPKRYT